MSELAYAKEIRKRSLFGFLLALPICAVWGGVVGYGYAYFVGFNPLIYIGFLAALVVGFAIGLGAVIISGMFGATDRLTRFLCAVVGVVVCLWLYYSQWLNMQGARPWSLLPIQQWYEIGFIEPFQYAFEKVAPQVNYSVSRAGRSSSDLGTGGAMWFWIIEIALIVLPAALISAVAEGDHINSATGGKMNSLDTPITIADVTENDIRNAQPQLQARDFSVFQPLSQDAIARLTATDGPKKRDKVPAASMQVFQDSKHPDTYSIEVKRGAYTYDRKEGWSDSYDGDVVLSHLLLSKTEYDRLAERVSS